MNSLPTLLRRFWLWIAVSTALSAVFTAGMILVLRNRFAFGILILWNDGFFWDLWVFQQRFEHFRTPQFWDPFLHPFTYPAAMGVVLAVMFKIPHIVKLYLLACAAAATVWAWILARELAARGVARRVALSFAFSVAGTAWPVWLLMTSANTEGLVAVLVAGGVWSVLRRSYWIAAMLLALAGVLKIFPLALLALLLSRRRYKEFAFAIVLVAVLNVASLAVLGPTVGEAQRHIAAGMVFVKFHYSLGADHFAPDVSHSLFAPIKFALALSNRMLHPETWRSSQTALLSRAYDSYLATACLVGALLYFVRIRTLPMLSQVFALTICMVLLPPYSVDYTLLHLMLPFGLLCVYATEMWRDQVEVQGLRACMICFAYLFPIGTFFTLKYRFGSLVRCFALCALLVVVMRFPFRWKMLDDAEVTA